MSKLLKIDKEYTEWINKLSLRFRKSQIKAAVKVNSEMLHFYWSVGEDIVIHKADSKWGEGFYKGLSQDLQDIFPSVKGFSVRNLQYMKQMYEVFSKESVFTPQVVAHIKDTPKEEITPQIVAQYIKDSVCHIPWGHIRYILDKKYDSQKSFFFVRQVIEHNWSRAVLLNFLDTNLYERHGKAITNFKNTFPAIESDLAQEMTKDPYNFDFIGITNKYNEKELKDTLIKNIQNFLIELGTGFAYMGREYRLMIGETEQFLDMLFYNVDIHSFVVVEVKTTQFEPAFLGQLGTYVVAVDHLLKKAGDNKTIGLLICKTKDDVFARYSLEASSQPIGISEYELSHIFPKEFKSSLPSIEDIEEQLK